VGEVLATYGQGGGVASLPKLTPYRDYLEFIAGQDQAAGLAAWRDALAGLEEGTRLTPRAMPGQAAIAPEQVVLTLDGKLSQSLTRFSREHALTLNTVLQTSYGLLLGRQLNRDEVVFGVTVAGRPAELVGAERMVGLFINTLPLRLSLPPQLPLIELLRRTQDRQSGLLMHQHVGLAAIQQAVGVGELFDTLVVFENYPVERAALTQQANGLKLTHVEGRDATHYPLALIVQPGDELRLRFDGRSLPPTPAGWTRDFLLKVDGWAKDRDPNTAHSTSVEPLPFHGMSGYPYRADEHFPDDEAHRKWRNEWNTRKGFQWIRPLADVREREWLKGE
jgi:hypothetical protein